MRTIPDHLLLNILLKSTILKLDTHFIELIQQEIYRRNLEIEFPISEEKFEDLVNIEELK